MNERTFDLNSIFNLALQAMQSKRQEVNELDGYNGNHGDNMVTNLELIANAVREKSSVPPAEALRYAGDKLQQAGHGGTSQYYATGLQQASQTLQGHAALNQDDVVTLVQTLLGALPAQSGPAPQPQARDSVLGQLVGGLLGGQSTTPAPQPSQAAQGAGDMLGQLLGGLTRPAAPQPQAPAPRVPESEGFGLDDVVNKLLPAGLAYLQAKQGGADTTSAASQALVQVLLSGQTSAAQTTPRAAAGTIIAQSILQGLFNK